MSANQVEEVSSPTDDGIDDIVWPGDLVGIYDKCRLCHQLEEFGHTVAYDEFLLPYGNFYVESSLCKCGPPWNKIHVLCLQRWLRFTADRPCTRCRTRFTSPDHIGRDPLSFWDVLRNQYWNYYFISWMFLNLYLVGNRFWLTLDTNVDEHWGRTGRLLDTVATVHHLLVMSIPLNLILLGGFRLFFLFTNKLGACVTFIYRFGAIDSTQLYCLEMVARFQLPQTYRRNVNLGQLYHVCSYCGLRLIGPAECLRYYCECYALHRQCLLQALRDAPGELLCHNCGRLIVRPPEVRLWALLLRDMLTRSAPEAWAAWNYLINSPKVDGFRMYPSFATYLFTSRAGLTALLPFLLSTCLYGNLECTPHARWCWSCSSATSGGNFNIFQGFEFPIWTLVWVCAEFSIAIYGQYLKDLVDCREQLGSRIIIEEE